MIKNEENKGEEEVKKDSLMWSEEDYDAMQKLTGFDEESIVQDQKKGINLIVFIVVCIISLIVGILIGYNVNKKAPESQVIITEEIKKNVETVAIYSRMNISNELYLYVLNSENEEISILDLTNLKYSYKYINGELLVLIEKDGLKLYKYSFSNDGYHRDLIKQFEGDYDAFYFENNIILVKNKKDIKLYNLNGELIREVTIDVDKLDAYTADYIVYTKDSKLYIYYMQSKLSNRLTRKETSFKFLDNDEIFYIEKDKLYKYSIIGDITKELMTIKANSIFAKFNDYYIFNDGKVLYIYENKIMKLKELEHQINEIAYLNRESVILILDDYNPSDCLMKDNNFNLFNVKSKYLGEIKINGCLNTQVINDLINVK